ncbi:PLP-dependent transferase [Ascodesmis nigricans]|uniref:PLP-dependent transferase n=1 Tax=Ascodesmis nigricans TaxID=341454 RepID=A0A4S2MZJ4_9PEZI|nr:PLP-dependent transferase [Ascodesmis nigricans]
MAATRLYKIPSSGYQIPRLLYRTLSTSVHTLSSSASTSSSSSALSGPSKISSNTTNNMDSEQFREAAQSAIDKVVKYYENIAEHRVVSKVEPGYLKPLLPDGPPLTGEPWAEIEKDIKDKILPGVTHWQHPNFLAFFPANSSYPGILGEIYSAAFTSANFNWLCSPAATELETIVLDWLCKLLNLPECYLSTSSTGGGGVIQGSASEAVVTVVVAARDRYLRHLTSGITDPAEKERVEDAHRSKLVALVSDQAHSCTQKGCMVAGVKYRTVKVPRHASTNTYTLTGDILRNRIEELKAEGLEPFYVTVTLGTTSLCAVDDFASIAQLRKDYPKLWIHVDAAYAGAALVCPEYQSLTPPFEHFDSFDMNMHKWLLTNFDCSCLFVKERKHLINALSLTPEYLRNSFSEKGLVTDYRDWQIPLGRRFRALKLWFVMRTFGVEGLQAHIRHTVSTGLVFSKLVQERPDRFQIFTPPAFALTVFSVNPIVPDEEGSVERRNEITKEVYEAVNADGEIFITSSIIDGNYVMRVVSGNAKIEEKHLQRAFEIILQKTEDIRAKGAHTPPVVEEKELKGV